METEIHCERVLNVVGSGAQHQTLFKDTALKRWARTMVNTCCTFINYFSLCCCSKPLFGQMQQHINTIVKDLMRHIDVVFAGEDRRAQLQKGDFIIREVVGILRRTSRL